MKEVTIPVPDEVQIVAPDPDGTIHFPGDHTTFYVVTVQVSGHAEPLTQFVIHGGGAMRIVTARYDADTA